MKSRDSADNGSEWAVSENPFFVGFQTRLTTVIIYVESTEPLFTLLRLQDC